MLELAQVIKSTELVVLDFLNLLFVCVSFNSSSLFRLSFELGPWNSTVNFLSGVVLVNEQQNRHFLDAQETDLFDRHDELPVHDHVLGSRELEHQDSIQLRRGVSFVFGVHEDEELVLRRWVGLDVWYAFEVEVPLVSFVSFCGRALYRPDLDIATQAQSRKVSMTFFKNDLFARLIEADHVLELQSILAPESYHALSLCLMQESHRPVARKALVLWNSHLDIFTHLDDIHGSKLELVHHNPLWLWVLLNQVPDRNLGHGGKDESCVAQEFDDGSLVSAITGSMDHLSELVILPDFHAWHIDLLILENFVLQDVHSDCVFGIWAEGEGLDFKLVGAIAGYGCWWREVPWVCVQSVRDAGIRAEDALELKLWATLEGDWVATFSKLLAFSAKMKVVLINHGFVVIESADFDWVVRENAWIKRGVCTCAQRQVRNLTTSKSADESFVLLLKVPLHKDRLLACCEQVTLRTELHGIDSVSMPLWQALDDQLGMASWNIHEIEEDVDLTKVISNGQGLPILWESQAHQLWLPRNDLALARLTDGLRDDVLPEYVDQFVVQYLHSCDW